MGDLTVPRDLPALEVPTQYLDTLLTYYEEEVAGEAYFLGLMPHFNEGRKLEMLAMVECHAARSVAPLLGKYGLTPRSQAELAAEGLSHVSRHASLDWNGMVDYMVTRYPGYLDDFAALEAMAPAEDLPMLKKLTAHEVAAIAFADREQQGDEDSLAPLKEYLETPV